MICSQTAASTGPGRFSSSSVLAVAVSEAVDRQGREPGEDAVTDPRSRRAHENDPLDEKPARYEQHDLRRGGVEPVRIVDHAEKRLLIRDLGQQGQRREADQETVGGIGPAAGRTPSPEPRAAGRAVGRRDRASARRADVGRCRRVPPPIRFRPRSRRATRQHAQSNSSRSALLPAPASPRSTTTRLRPSSASVSAASRNSHSARRPSSLIARLPRTLCTEPIFALPDLTDGDMRSASRVGTEHLLARKRAALGLRLGHRSSMPCPGRRRVVCAS